MRNTRYALVKIIYDDLRVHGKVQLFLLLLIIITAISIIIVTYQTRCTVIDREKFLLEKEFLLNELNSLILKKEVLSNHIRIERIAINKLNMHYIDSTLNDSSK